MAAINLICAGNDNDRAYDISRRLVAEGHDVRISFREEDTCDWQPGTKTCTVVLWSNESRDCWPVREMARAADASRSLVHVALEPVTPPIPATPAAIDFSRWRGERTGAWRLLQERIERVGRGEARAANHFFPSLALTAASVTLVGFSILLRMEDGPAPAQTAMMNAPVQLSGGRVHLPGPEDSVGGPTDQEAAEFGQDIEVRLVRAPREMQRVRLSAPLPELATPRPLQTVEIRRGFIGQVLRARELLPFVGDGNRPNV
jgi:hypothetical protein